MGGGDSYEKGGLPGRDVSHPVMERHMTDLVKAFQRIENPRHFLKGHRLVAFVAQAPHRPARFKFPHHTPKIDDRAAADVPRKWHGQQRFNRDGNVAGHIQSMRKEERAGQGRLTSRRFRVASRNASRKFAVGHVRGNRSGG